MKNNGTIPAAEDGRNEAMDDLLPVMQAEPDRTEGEEKDEASDSEDMKGFLDFLSRMAFSDSSDSREDDDDDGDFGDDDDDYDDDPPEDEMDADDYHNRAVDFARKHAFAKAVQICEDGLRIYPGNTDLLADAVKYCAENGDKPRAQKYYETLCSTVPRSQFNWRAFTFSLDYLMLDAQKNEAECRSLLEDYGKALPYEEKRFVAASELETALGNHERSMEILKEAVATLHNASQCSLRLADLQLERGQFEDALRTADYGLIASAQVQPTINIPYLYYVRTLASDALLRLNKDEIDRDAIDTLREMYKKLLDVFPSLHPYRRTMTTRMKLLDLLELTVE